MKEKLVFISMHLPEPSVPEAGQKLAYRRLIDLTKDYKEVHLVTFSNERENTYLCEETFSKCTSVNIIKITNRKRLTNILRSPLLPINISARCDNEMISIVNSFGQDVDVHIEYQQGLSCIPKSLFQRTTLVLHDVLSQSLERFYSLEKNAVKRLIKKMQLKKMLAWEKKYFGIVKNITVLNDKDFKIARGISGRDNVLIEYPVVDESFYKVDRSKYEKERIMFWGAMNRKENIDAVLWFVNEIFPAVKLQIPKIKLDIVGANPTDEITNLRSNSINVTGFVNSPISYFEKNNLCIVPLRYGAGIKIKVLEALAAKMNIVSTSVGAEGIVDKEGLIFVCDSPDEFTNKIVALIK